MSREKWKTQFQVIDSASKFHNKVRQIFATDTFFRQMKCFQEVPVVDLCPGYRYSNHHFDWYIDELHTVLELHGVQHYKVVNFGNVGAARAKKNFEGIQQRDQQKAQAVIDAGFEYRVIKYDEIKQLDADFLKRRILLGGG